MDIAQIILDCFPDFVSQYGLLGCAIFVETIGIAAGLAGIYFQRRFH